jgi:hypothetical protein
MQQTLIINDDRKEYIKVYALKNNILYFNDLLLKAKHLSKLR